MSSVNNLSYINKFIELQKASDPNVFIVDGQDFEDTVIAAQQNFATAMNLKNTMAYKYNIISETLDGENIIFVADSTFTSINVTLPSADDNLGIRIIVKWMAGANPVNIVSSSGIDGSSPFLIPSVGDAIHLIAGPKDGSSYTWIVI